MTQASHPLQLTRRHLLLGAASLGAGGLLAACGGGGDDGAMSSGGAAGATSFASGPITGFGSIIVGGVRFDESAARVEGDDGQTRRRDELKLGAVVEIEGGRLDRGLGLGTAMRVVLGHSLLGPRTDAAVAGATGFVLLGQTVVVTASTVFDASVPGGSLDGIAQGDIVEAHALYDPVARQFLATRLEVKTVVTEYRLRGPIGSLDTTAQTFMLGTEKVFYGSALPAVQASALFEGAFVRVNLQTIKDTTRNAWVATQLRVGLRSLSLRNDAEAEIEGVITSFTSPQSFVLNGLPVDASAATFVDGTSGVVAGARVEVSGTIANGVLVATRVELEDGPHMGGGRGGRMPFEFHGTISGLDTTGKTFVLRDTTIWYGGAVAYSHGSEADLANGRRVEVKGVIAPDRTRIEARRIDFES